MPTVSIRETGAVVIMFPKTVVKLPLSVSCLREIRLEKKLLAEVAVDLSFKSRVPRCGYLGFIQSCERLAPFRVAEDAPLLETYLRDAFRDSSRWPTTGLRRLLRQAELQRVAERAFPEHLPFLEAAMDSLEMPQSSAHGDFHADNILVRDGRLAFIDWGHFNAATSRFFDLIDFHVHSLKSPDESWTDAWRRSARPSSLHGIPVRSEYYDAYALWKLCEDLWILNLRGRLDGQKARRYGGFIKELRSKWPL